jgi:hypothetical protein
LFAAAEPEEAAQARQPAGHRRPRVIALVHVRHVSAQRGDRHGVNFRHASGEVPKVFENACQVFAVRFDRQCRTVAFDPQVIQERLNRRPHDISCSASSREHDSKFEIRSTKFETNSKSE